MSELIVVEKHLLDAIGDAIRNKTNSSQKFTLIDIPTSISSISTNDGSGGQPGGSTGPTISGGAIASINITTIGTSGFVQSTAEGQILYLTLIADVVNTTNALKFAQETLTYLSAAKKYRFALSEGTLEETPIIVLTTGTITMPSSSTHDPQLISSGAGYAIYKYVKKEE